ncbi:MAG: hypothetical protein BHV77_09355 [Bacteroides sp. 43_108]|nr:MAG: hypothetical protein BHV77_09355 [Bacteroides sp. 43_108]
MRLHKLWRKVSNVFVILLMPVNIYFCKGLKSGVYLNPVLIRNLFECDVYVRRKNSLGVWVNE